jgi:hypothetical protein
MALTNSSAQLAISGNLNQTITATGPLPNTINFTGVNQSFSIGNGTGKFNNGYCNNRTVASGTPDVINLSSTPNLPQIDGSTLPALSDIVGLAITYVSSTGNGTLEIGAGTDPVTTIWGNGTLNILPGGSVSFMASGGTTGYAITATTADRITVNSSTGNITYCIEILGH